MFETFSKHLESAIKTLKGHDRITEINIATTLKEIRRALIQADVSYKVAKQFTNTIKEQALGKKILTSVSPGQLFTKLVGEALTTLMGTTRAPLNLTGNPAIILLTGLQGAGKTTLAGKLALYLKKNHKQVLLAACDIYRPAAVQQLQTLGNQLDIAVYAEPHTQDVLQIAQGAVKQAKALKKQVIIIDTAGRLAIDTAMMHELVTLKKKIQPTEILFVVDAMTGQDAVNTAQRFNEQLDIDGVVLTKLDSDTRGGAALSIRSIVDKPIKFISTGEKLDALDAFHPDRMANRILGMGDVISLVERAEQVYTEEQKRKISQKFRKNVFNFEDFLTQMQQIKKMGSMKELVGMLPGMGSLMKKEAFQEEDLKPFETFIQAMTPQERRQPTLLSDSSRRARIAKGSGLPMQQINSMIKQFQAMCDFMRKAQQQGIKNVLKNWGA